MARNAARGVTPPCLPLADPGRWRLLTLPGRTFRQRIQQLGPRTYPARRRCAMRSGAGFATRRTVLFLCSQPTLSFRTCPGKGIRHPLSRVVSTYVARLPRQRATHLATKAGSRWIRVDTLVALFSTCIPSSTGMGSLLRNPLPAGSLAQWTLDPAPKALEPLADLSLGPTLCKAYPC